MIPIPPPPGPNRKGLLGEFSSDEPQEQEFVGSKSEAAFFPAFPSPEELVPEVPPAELLAAKELEPGREVELFPPGPSSLCLSFEFFPPHTPEGMQKLKMTTRLLGAFYPSYYSVTFGAAGNVQDYTVKTVLSLKECCITPIAPHISCVGGNPDSIRNLLEIYKNAGISRIVVLRGDRPSGMMYSGHFPYAADLVAFIRKEYGNHFYIEVAAYPECHPESRDPDRDLKHFRCKVEQGADRAITQYFYNKDCYYYYLDSCARAGISIPIIPGIMPITNYHQLQRFSNACGAEIPRWLRMRLETYADDPVSLQKLGQEFVTRMCQDLLDYGVPGLHFYTLNKAEPSVEICQSLKWK